MTTFTGSPPVTTASDVDSDGRTNTRNGSTTTSKRALSRIPTIADQYSGLLDDLSPGQRRGLIAKLSVGYYEGWRPTRAQLARYIHDEFGRQRAGFPGQQDPASARRASR